MTTTLARTIEHPTSEAPRGSLVRRLRDVRFADTPDVGRKAASLGELLAAGARVPDGVVLTASIADLAPAERAAVIRSAVADLGPGPFAVRSSGIAEDGMEHSFAGLYETVLDVPADGVAAAAERCLASARAGRVSTYANGVQAPMAVIVQRMVRPTAAGVALTADPINGDRGACAVTAVRGIGERLVSGNAVGDEWVVRGRSATALRQPEHAIDRRAALRVADEARRVASARGEPQDIEWAIGADGSVWLLQARPMTALPPDASWAISERGAYTRTFRFGEWINGPVTPLFESWLLRAMEARLHECAARWIGQIAPRPYHVVVNGWYFYSLNFIAPRAMLRSLPGIVWRLIRRPRRVAIAIPPTVRHGFALYERDWREDLLPRYRAAVAGAEARVEVAPVTQLPELIDELATLAGEYFASLAVVAGSAYKLEINLARFYRRFVAPVTGGTHLELLTGFTAPAPLGAHAVASLDWAEAPAVTSPFAPRPEEHERLVEARRAAEAAAFEAVSGSPKRLREFRRLLADAQHLVPVREEQVAELTLPWPVMRRAVLRIGEALTGRGVLRAADDVFSLTQAETLGALRGEAMSADVDIDARHRLRAEQARLVPPVFVGSVNPALRRFFAGLSGMVGGQKSEGALVSGAPASPGRVTGIVRVIRGPNQFDELQPGEILVAPITAPAWTPLFTRAAAVVTDIGSAASHTSIIAREYGLPAVVGCGDATSRLRTGMHVTVDGTTGNVEPA